MPVTAATILDEAGALKTLGDVFAWAQARTPTAEFVASVAQDEYTHDIVFRAAPEVYLAFDTT